MTDTIENVKVLVHPYLHKTGGLIAALRVIQEKFHFIPEAADAVIADAFNLSRAEVKGVISFYTDFTRAPKGRVVVKVCAAEACQAMGAKRLQKEIEAGLGVKTGEGDQHEQVSLEQVYCLGLCSAAPAAMVSNALLARATAAKVQDLLDDQGRNI